MFAYLRRRRPAPSAVLPGRRVYAVGDIHGRLDLFDILLERIAADNASRAAAEVDLILLGDLIDRGPDSAGVLNRAMNPPDWCRLIALRGNHEAALLDALDGDRDMMRMWLRFGGDATLRSWGANEDVLKHGTLEELISEARTIVPPEVRRWLMRTRSSIRIGDYYFAHAGIRPGVPIDRQTDHDMLWIRNEFLESSRDHGVIVVHGHSVTAEVQELPNRIGLDTGAYSTGRLTAIGLEGTDRWLLQTGETEIGG